MSPTAQQDRSVVAYVAPMCVYLLATAIAGRFEGQAYAVAYAAAALVAGGVCWACRRDMVDLVPHRRVLPGVGVGVVGIVAWIWLSELQVEQTVWAYLPSFLRPSHRPAFQPWVELGGAWAWGFIAVRVVGMAVVVPIAEELFWRGFLLRWWIDPERQRVRIGTYTWSSCAGVTLLFALAHPEWLAAAVYCLLLNALLYWRRDLWLCVVAHGTSNLLLAMYVLVTGAWHLW
ncbi:MAG: CAAX prenyl protease-related protein [Planctomycetota bacterium]|nr:MAG: CAAX prenyl protease-related protein [Planctomycetota bacterium]